MTQLKTKSVLIPIQEELETIKRLVSEKEKRTNPRLRKQMGKIHQRLLRVMETLFGAQQPELAGAY